MFDLGFEPQVMKIIDNVRPDRQTVLFSATFPRQMEALARKILDKPVEVLVGGRSVVAKDISQHVVSSWSGACTDFVFCPCVCVGVCEHNCTHMCVRE